jgi:putative salt-induced outer membrane protein YdiY
MQSRLLLVLLSCLPTSALADVVHLANGDRVSGTLVSVDGSAVLMDAPWAGRVRIEREAVRSIESDAPLGVELDGGEEADFRLVETASGEQGLQSADGATREVGVGALALVYRDAPPRELVDEFRLDATYGLNITAGNADTQTHSVRGNLRIREGDQRHSTKLEVDRKIDEGDVTKDQYRLGHQIDWFVTDDWYAYGTGEYFSDAIKEVDYRMTLGVGAGHQFWDDSLGALSAEAGASVVIEEIGGEGEENPALRAGLKYNRFFLGGDLELFHSDERLMLTDFDRGQILNTSTGLRFAINGRWKADARIDLVYETEPAAGNEKVDVTYILGVGYSM